MFSVFGLASCDSHPEYEKKIKNYMMGKLKDPDSAQYIFKGYMQGKIDGHDVTVYIVFINAKNGYGAFTGYKEYEFAIYKNPSEISGLLLSQGGVEEVSHLTNTDRFEIIEKMKLIND
jgi:hypothetical protein